MTGVGAKPAAETLLIRHAAPLVTMDEGRRVIRDGALFARGGVIELVGSTRELPAVADVVVDASNHAVLPGMVNVHGHLFQSLVRVLPQATGAELGGWLQAHYPLWARLDAAAMRTAARFGLAELLRSGCTTVFDHHTALPGDVTLDISIEAAAALGIRFVAGRGARTLGSAPAALRETRDHILADFERLIDRHHDPRPHAMSQVCIAPPQLGTIERELAIELIEFARAKGVRGHTHLGETADEIGTYMARFGMRPYQYAEDVGWIAQDTWLAHGVHLDAGEIAGLARAGCGIAHCPSSNLWLGSGTAPVVEWLRAGVLVGLGVDGPASNGAADMLGEVRMAMLLQRGRRGPSAFSALDALELATRGGARLLGRRELGALAPGGAADVIAFDLARLELAGAPADPVTALVACAVRGVDLAIVAGRVRWRDGAINGFDLEREAALHRALSARAASPST